MYKHINNYKNGYCFFETEGNKVFFEASASVQSRRCIKTYNNVQDCENAFCNAVKAFNAANLPVKEGEKAALTFELLF